MISVSEAWDLLFQNPLSLKTREVAVSDALSGILSSDIFAPLDHPFFNYSAVDGYAFQWDDMEGKALENLSVTAEIPAGKILEKPLNKGTLARIFTGAAIPVGADTVVMQEFVSIQNNLVAIHDPGLKKGSNVRKKGDHIRQGSLALGKGSIITAPMVGYLLSLGVVKVNVVVPPRVTLIVTGNEFASGPDDLAKGKIFESNGEMIWSACQVSGWGCRVLKSEDDPVEMLDLLSQRLDDSDLILFSGGVSVGNFDFTGSVLEKSGFKTIFHKVAMKPGKPLLFAKKENKAAFGLPGNPRSAMMGYYFFVLPFIQHSMGMLNPGLKKLSLPLASAYHKKGERAEFLTYEYGEGGILIGTAQDSHMLSSFSKSMGVAFIPADRSDLGAGEWVEVYILP